MLKVENSAGNDPGGAAYSWLSSRREPVWLCEACERAPAAFLCKADAASLCAACDSDIHSANPLARRHHRVPIPQVASTLYGPSAPGLITGPAAGDAEEEFLTQDADETGDGDDEDEAASWLLLNPVKNSDNQSHDNGPTAALFGGTMDEYLDLDDYNSCQNSQFNEHFTNQQQHYSDSVVPTQYQKVKDCFQLGLEYEVSNTAYSYPTSMSHNVSLSPMDVGVVPESTMTEISISGHQRAPKGTIDLFSGPPIQVPTQLTPMDREARVLRYREKKKTRKFEKTIRYASRKAYAETRPRIKGRFAKRKDVGVEVEQMFAAPLMGESEYGIVPSF